MVDQQGSGAGALADVDHRIADLEARLNLRFADRALPVQALVHKSALIERSRAGQPLPDISSNERLEFLGDSVLTLLVSHLVYDRFPDFDEGRLTEARSALVRRSTLARLAESLGLANLVYMSVDVLRGDSRGRATVLAEAFEAVLGAIYLDHGFEAARQFVAGQYAGRIDELVAQMSLVNAKSRLQEKSQAILREVPRYSLLSRRGPDHDSRFEVEVRAGPYVERGEGSSKQAAEQSAARALLDVLEAAPPPHARGSQAGVPATHIRAREGER